MDLCSSPPQQMTTCPPGTPSRGGPSMRGPRDPSPVGRPDAMYSPRQLFTDDGAAADPCSPPSQQRTRCPPGSPTNQYPQMQQQDPCTPPSQQRTRCPPGSPTNQYPQMQQQDPCTPPSHQRTRSPPGSPDRECPQLQQQDPCTPPSQQMNRCPPARTNRECQPGMRRGGQNDTSPVARPNIQHAPRIVMQNDEFARQCDQLLAQWGGYFTSPQSIGGRSVPQSPPSMPSSPGSDVYWATSDEDGFHSAGSDMSSNRCESRGSSPPLSSLESGFSTPILTPSDMSPASDMLPSAFHATDTNVVRPNFETILLIIDYLANTFCEDRKQRLDQINCYVKQLACLQGNELQDTLLTLRDLIIRRGRMLPDLYDYFRALADELKHIRKKAIDRHKPVPNLSKLCELANRRLDPYLSQETYIKIINDLRLFADWAYLRCSHEKHTNDKLQNEIEDVMCSPKKLEDFRRNFCELYEEGSGSIEVIGEILSRSQLQIDKFLTLWAKGGEVLNKPVPDDMVRIYIQLPNLDTPELEANVAPGAPVTGTGINAEPLGPPPPPPGYQPLLQAPIAPPPLCPPHGKKGKTSSQPCPAAIQPPQQPCPTRPGPSRYGGSQQPQQPCPAMAGPSRPAEACNAPGPSGLQSGRFANAPIPGPGVRAANTSSSDSSPSCPGYY